MYAETRLVERIRKALDLPGVLTFKIHGSGMQTKGMPDIIGCVFGIFIGIEVKMPGEEPTAIQRYMLEQMARAGAVVGVAYSVEDALDVYQSALSKLQGAPLSRAESAGGDPQGIG